MPSASRPPEIKALAGARAFPPLILVLFHFCEGHGYRGAGWFDMPVGKGYLWVEFFFALSGFILIHVYGPRAPEFRRGKAYWAFLQARLSRLYPLHVFTLFSMLFLMLALDALADLGGYVSIYHQPYHPMNTAWSFVANLFLVQGWNLFPWLTWNGASWFVSVEFFLCLLFPVFLLLSRGGWLRAFALIGAGVAALAFMSRTSGHGLDITFHDSVFRGMAGFAIGAGLATLFRLANDAGAGRLPDWVHSAVQAAALGFLYWATYRTGWAHQPNDIWTALALDTLVFVLAFDRGFLAQALSMAVPRKLGEWSYAIYMGQTFWLQLVRTCEQRLYPPPDSVLFGQRFADLIWWIEPAALVLVCVGWGALLAVFIEHPANAALRRMISRRKQALAT